MDWLDRLCRSDRMDRVGRNRQIGQIEWQRQVERQKNDRKIGRQIDRQIDRQRGKQMDRQKDRKTDRQTDRQIDGLSYIDLGTLAQVDGLRQTNLDR